MNNFNLNSNDDYCFPFKKKFKINVFRSAVLYKKYKFKYSKYKRKALGRVKHATLWLVPHNAFKGWAVFYLKNKHSAKNQFFTNIFIKNFFLFNASFVKNKNETIFYNLNFIFSAFTKRNYSSYLMISRYQFSLRTFRFFPNNNISFAWYDENPEAGTLITPTYSQWDSTLFKYSAYTEDFQLKHTFDLNDIFTLMHDLNTLKVLEFYRILILYSVLLLESSRNCGKTQ